MGQLRARGDRWPSQFRSRVPSRRADGSVNALGTQQSTALLDYLGIVEDSSSVPDSDAYAVSVHSNVESTDRAYTAIYRQEQPFLRALLLPNNTACCDLCGREFDSRYLRAAHIKKRAACSETERLDAKNGTAA